MDSALLVHRLAFCFYRHLSLSVSATDHGAGAADRGAEDPGARTGNEIYNQSARFWAKIFGINFVLGVVTGIPMEFQFGTNWARFSRVTGGVIGQPLAMEGVFSFFLESAFLGLFLFGEKRLGPLATGGRASWCFWIVAFRILHHRDGCVDAASGRLRARGGRQLPGHQLLGPAAQSVGASAIRAQHERRRHHRRVRDGWRRRFLPAQRTLMEHARVFVRFGVIAGGIVSALQIFPTGDLQGKNGA